MNPKILQNAADHQAALDQVEALMDAAPGSPEEEDLKFWTLLIEDYEAKHQPILPLIPSKRSVSGWINWASEPAI